MPLRVEMRVGLHGLREREDPIDHTTELVLGDRTVHDLKARPAADEHAANRDQPAQRTGIQCSLAQCRDQRELSALAAQAANEWGAYPYQRLARAGPRVGAVMAYEAVEGVEAVELVGLHGHGRDYGGRRARRRR
jgi:hypothetical protein